MIIANTNYNDTLMRLEQLKCLIEEVEDSIENQIPQGITNEFAKSKSLLVNWIEEIEVTLMEYQK
jgi:hypothetical protein